MKTNFSVAIMSQMRSNGDKPDTAASTVSPKLRIRIASTTATIPSGIVIVKYGKIPSGKTEGNKYGKAHASIEMEIEIAPSVENFVAFSIMSASKMIW